MLTKNDKKFKIFKNIEKYNIFDNYIHLIVWEK